eukprot:364843-Chlamydomonas_euryale.AAC.8
MAKRVADASADAEILLMPPAGNAWALTAAQIQQRTVRAVPRDISTTEGLLHKQKHDAAINLICLTDSINHLKFHAAQIRSGHMAELLAMMHAAETLKDCVLSSHGMETDPDLQQGRWLVHGLQIQKHQTQSELSGLADDEQARIHDWGPIHQFDTGTGSNCHGRKCRKCGAVQKYGRMYGSNKYPGFSLPSETLCVSPSR